MAPYIVLNVPGEGTVQVRNVYTFKTIATIKPLPGQSLGTIEPAGDDRAFVIEAQSGKKERIGPEIIPSTVDFDELRLGSDGLPLSLVELGNVPAKDFIGDIFAVSQDASMLAYGSGDLGFETVSLATGTGRYWLAVDGNEAGSLSWAGDRTLAFEWDAANNPDLPGFGVRVVNVASRGNLLQASRLVVGYSRYRSAASACRGGGPVVTADGSKLLISQSIAHGGAYADSVGEFSARTGKFLPNVATPVPSAYVSCVPLWSNPSGERVISYCSHAELFDHGSVRPITIHNPMYGTVILSIGW